MQRVFLALAVLVSLVGSEATAQGTIRGVLYDSLLTSKPVADAEVVLLGANRSVKTDSRGRFDIPDVPAGKHAVAFWAPWLDSVALPAIQQEIEVAASGSSAIAMLATPSLAAYQLAACGTELAPEMGILIGEVRGPDGAPMPGIGVSTRWSETRIGVGQFERILFAAVDTSNAAGLYVICGVPVGNEVALRAIGSGGVGSNEIVIPIPAVVQRRDLAVAPRDLLTRIVGRVLSHSGTPIAAAAVALVGDSARVARTDDEGKFVLDSVPRRSSQIVARALGHIPRMATVELSDAVSDVDDIQLERIPQELSAVMVDGEPLTAGRLAFMTRRERGLGSFIDDETMSRMANKNSTLVAALVPRTTIRQTRQGPMILLRRGSDFCRPRFFIDGYDNGDITADEEGSVMNRAKRIEIYTANAAPPQFNDFDGCGAVVIWTR